jgi:acyl-ACP thioesterase
LRPDGAARFLQDVATDDYDELDIDRDLTWVVRRTVLRVTEGGRWPH